jgi:alpha-glucosidase (family GH31 glycosyl hydrolase)
MIRYYYSNMLLISQGSTTNFRRGLYQPLFFEFPEDLNTYNDIRYNIMLGSALKLSVNSDSLKVTQTNFYFPAGTWCNIIRPTDACIKSTGQQFLLSSKAYDYYVHLREGYIVPY